MSSLSQAKRRERLFTREESATRCCHLEEMHTLLKCPDVPATQPILRRESPTLFPTLKPRLFASPLQPENAFAVAALISLLPCISSSSSFVVDDSIISALSSPPYLLSREHLLYPRRTPRSILNLSREPIRRNCTRACKRINHDRKRSGSTSISLPHSLLRLTTPGSSQTCIPPLNTTNNLARQ